MPDPQRGTHRLGRRAKRFLSRRRRVEATLDRMCRPRSRTGITRAAGCVRADHTNPGVQLKTCPVGTPPGC
jgi:hypothetical protein